MDAHIPDDTPEMDPLQRAGAVALIEDGFDSVHAIEGPDGMEADLLDSIVAVYPGGALLKVFVDAPALEFAEEAVRSVVGELLERSELLAHWQIERCEVELHPELRRVSRPPTALTPRPMTRPTVRPGIPSVTQPRTTKRATTPKRGPRQYAVGCWHWQASCAPSLP
ncbi:hypothetical protein ACLGIH_30240 [Streptomyces sp. HMX87]|uniref:hypothetical protein n=1 Tax=Streptomyces sp. HMX87 TaxID=3390849 RepID=UPI003A877801